MKEKNVIIFLRSVQTLEGSIPDAAELISEGTLSTGEDGEWVLSYQESELTGMAGTTTRFHIWEDIIVLEREGAISSQMIFQEGQPCSSLYETPWGTASLDIATYFLSCTLGERGGVLELHYAISVEDHMMGETYVQIRVKETRSALPV